MGKLKRGFFLAFFLLVLFLFLPNVGAESIFNSPGYIPCLDNSYGWMPSPWAYPEYYDRNYPGHNAVILHRKHVYCSNDQPYPLAMKGLKEQHLTINGPRRVYCNYICRDRKQEQCYDDGSFDTWYMEWCEDAQGNRIIIPGYENSSYWEPYDYDCYSDRDCQKDQSCVNGYCVNGTGNGEGNHLECTSTFDCGPGKICDEAKCVAPNGRPCNSTSQCSYGESCYRNQCVGFQCVYDEQCPSGNCDNGVCLNQSGSKIGSEKENEGGSKEGDENGGKSAGEISASESENEQAEDEQIASLEEPVSSATCGEDSDGGLDYYVKGTVKDSNGVEYTDYCLSGNDSGKLVEYYCSETGEVVSRTHLCLDLCNKGACIKKQKECMGCFVDGRCFFIGYRDSGQFCSKDKKFVSQLKENSLCDNNFECESNLCVNGACISQNLLKRIISFFKKLF